MTANRKDLTAGLLFIAIAALFALGALGQDLGTPRKLGPGAFPLLLSGILALLGAAVALKAFRTPAGGPVTIPWRGILLILVGPIIFGLTIRGLGLLATVALIVAVSTYASRRMSLWLSLAITIGLTAFCMLVFHLGLGLPIRLIGPWLSGAGLAAFGSGG
ncbi:MAG: tripartite tricarboxylate transporter TctB family protein [Rhodospirillaceae bacterium]|jgi:hypothetical protein|nr:tripartite tricarboxylate transporter TctB family protein [Rhodospirillaceae bacterium]